MDPDSYTKLKQEIARCAGTDADLQSIKLDFKSFISKRSLNRIISIEHLINHLEDLDYLHAEDVSCLEKLGNLLSDRKVVDLVNTYKKLRGLHEPCISSVRPCDRIHQATATHISSSEHHPLRFEDHRNLLQTRPNDLVCAIETLSSKLHTRWPVVIRELGLKEGYIRSLRKKYKGDCQKQALTALDYWSITDMEASVEKLHGALSSSECQRRGLSPQLTRFEPYVRMLM